MVYTRQIGLIANHMVAYEPLADNSSITTIIFENSSSCSACICAAFVSTIDYIAINCYKDNNICYLLTVLVNITGIISSENTSLYILTYISIPLNSEDDHIDVSPETTDTVTSRASFPITTASSTTAISASVVNLADATTATASSVGIVTVTIRTITTATMAAVTITTSKTITTASRITTTTSKITTTTHTTPSTTTKCTYHIGPICVTFG